MYMSGSLTHVRGGKWAAHRERQTEAAPPAARARAALTLPVGAAAGGGPLRGAARRAPGRPALMTGKRALCLSIFNLSPTQKTCLFTDGNKANVSVRPPDPSDATSLGLQAASL